MCIQKRQLTGLLECEGNGEKLPGHSLGFCFSILPVSTRTADERALKAGSCFLASQGLHTAIWIGVSGSDPHRSEGYITRMYPANTARWSDAGLLLGQRRRRWPNGKPASVNCVCHIPSADIKEFKHTVGSMCCVRVCHWADVEASLGRGASHWYDESKKYSGQVQD